jgi:peptidoglycan/xylan/chitin deacetylase (PgdA/CDA1 family)
MNRSSFLSRKCFTVMLLLTASALLPSSSHGAQNDAAPAAPSLRKTPPIIIIKVDDLRQQNDKVHERWQRLVDFARERKLKTSIGIITNSLEGDHPNYVKWIKEQQATGLFEFWDHGYDHREWTEDGKKLQEFKGPSYEQQKEHLLHSSKLAREKLGFEFQTFGAGFNAIDANTSRALKEIPNIKVWLYGDSKDPAGKVVMERVGAVNIENPIFTPSLAKFVEGYNRSPKRPYFVIQGHPQQWDEAKFAQFVQIVDFLTKEKAVFMTPSEYAKQQAATATR